MNSSKAKFMGLMSIGLLVITVFVYLGIKSLPQASNPDTDWEIVVRKFDDVPMVLVPNGCFQMGDNDRGYDNESPATTICFDVPFWIDQYEVSNAQFNQFADALQNDGRWSDDKLPRNLINWFEAREFCENRSARLPTEAEWEYAAKGPDNLTFSWGNEADSSRANLCDVNCDGLADMSIDDGFQYTSPIDAFPQDISWVGARNMTGNVGEWVSTIYADTFPYPYNFQDGRENLQDSSAWRGIRGGSFGSPIDWARTTFRNFGWPADGESVDLGFRCVRLGE